MFGRVQNYLDRANNFRSGLLSTYLYSNAELRQDTVVNKKEPKSNARLSKFDWHDLSPILARMLLHNLKIL